MKRPLYYIHQCRTKRKQSKNERQRGFGHSPHGTFKSPLFFVFETVIPSITVILEYLPVLKYGTCSPLNSLDVLKNMKFLKIGVLAVENNTKIMRLSPNFGTIQKIHNVCTMIMKICQKYHLMSS